MAVIGIAGPAHSATPATPLSIHDQTAGVNSKRETTVAVFCRNDPCKGSIKLTSHDKKWALSTFEIPPETTYKIKLRLSRPAFEALRTTPNRKVKVRATVKLETGHTVSHVITLTTTTTASSVSPATPLSINDQTDGVNAKGQTTIAVFCRKNPCKGKMKLGDGDTKLASKSFEIPPSTTYKIKMRLSRAAFDLLRSSPKRRMKVKATATLESGQVISHVITLKA